MRIAYGRTRFVILTESKAIKIAWFRFGLLKLLLIVVKGICNPKWAMQRIQARNLGGTSTGSVIVRYATYWVGFTAGVIANRQEQELYRKHPEQPLAEVLGIYFGGLVLIMARGKSVSAEESTSLRERFPESDLTDPANIGRFPAGLRFIDYGYPTLPAIFGAQAQ